MEKTRGIWVGLAMVLACSIDTRDSADLVTTSRDAGVPEQTIVALQPTPMSDGGSAPEKVEAPPVTIVEESDATPPEAVPDATTTPVETNDAGPACVVGPRDCGSDFDNDCDGQPDDTLDDVCRCLPGSVEACDVHPGLDGIGPCTPGSRTCILGQGTSDWTACAGAVGPTQDTCTAGDDSDCDGTPNEDCECDVARGNADCTLASASRCDGRQCISCDSDADCTQITAGRNSCRAGVCVLPIVPASLTGTTTVTPPRAALGGLALVIYVDDSISGAVLTVTFTSFATDAATIVSEINAVTSARVVASNVGEHISLSTVEAGAGVFLSVYDSEASSILGFQGLGTAEGQTL